MVRRVPAEVIEVRAGDPERVVTLLPGRGYTPQAPLLYFTSALLRQRGWTVRELWWDRLPASDESLIDQVLAAGDQALREVRARQHLVIAKSLGTLLLPLARELALPGVWLTPLLGEAAVREALGATSVPSLLVGGTADDGAWDTEIARGASAVGWEVMEIEGGDHRLELAGDVRGSLRVLGEVVDRVDDVAARAT